MDWPVGFLNLAIDLVHKESRDKHGDRDQIHLDSIGDDFLKLPNAFGKFPCSRDRSVIRCVPSLPHLRLRLPFSNSLSPWLFHQQISYVPSVSRESQQKNYQYRLTRCFILTPAFFPRTYHGRMGASQASAASNCSTNSRITTLSSLSSRRFLIAASA